MCIASLRRSRYGRALQWPVARRAHIVRQRTRLKNQVQSILHRNLVPRPPVADLFGIKGRCWLANQPLPPDEELAVEALLRQLDFHGQELRIIDASLGRIGLEREEVKRLMTIPASTPRSRCRSWPRSVTSTGSRGPSSSCRISG